MKIRCSDNIGIDLNSVVAWKKVKLLNGGGEVLNLFLAGSDNGFGFSIASNAVSDNSFKHLHNLLLNRFAIDLADETDISDEEGEDGIDYDLVDDLEDLPY